jgi:hypothetical protein
LTHSDCIADRQWLPSIAQRLADPRIQLALGSRRPRHDNGLLRLLCNYEDANAAATIGVSSAEAQDG